MHVPDDVSPGPQNPMGARAMYLFEGNKDTLYRIHGTNQPEYIGSAISSGCIRMTNEDVIDLYKRAKIGTPVVVLGPKAAAHSAGRRTACELAGRARDECLTLDKLRNLHFPRTIWTCAVPLGGRHRAGECAQ